MKAEEEKRAGLPEETFGFRESFRKLLTMTVEDEGQRNGLEALGVAPIYLNQILMASIKKAAGGDTAAARFIRDTIAEKTEEEKGRGNGEDLSELSDAQLRALAGEWPGGEGRKDGA